MSNGGKHRDVEPNEKHSVGLARRSFATTVGAMGSRAGPVRKRISEIANTEFEEGHDVGM